MIITFLSSESSLVRKAMVLHVGLMKLLKNSKPLIIFPFAFWIKKKKLNKTWIFQSKFKGKCIVLLETTKLPKHLNKQWIFFSLFGPKFWKFSKCDPFHLWEVFIARNRHLRDGLGSGKYYEIFLRFTIHL